MQHCVLHFIEAASHAIILWLRVLAEQGIVHIDLLTSTYITWHKCVCDFMQCKVQMLSMSLLDFLMSVAGTPGVILDDKL